MHSALIIHIFMFITFISTINAVPWKFNRLYILAYDILNHKRLGGKYEEVKRMTDRELLQSISDIIIGKIGTITDNMATKEDLSNMATKEDLSNMATKEDISNMATKEDLSSMATKEDISNMATKEDISNMATKEDISSMATKEDISNMATKEDLSNMATKEDLSNMATKEDISNMATKEDISNMATKEDISSMATKEDISNMATKEDISNIRAEIRENSNLILSAFDQTEQKMYARFDKVNEDMAKMREDIHTTRYSNEAVELILKKTADLEERVNKLENLQKIS